MSPYFIIPHQTNIGDPSIAEKVKNLYLIFDLTLKIILYYNFPTIRYQKTD